MNLVIIRRNLGFAAIISDLLPRVLGIVIAKKLHSELLNGVTHAPLSFFERTPSGRVLSRFSRDIYVVDTKLPEALVYSMYHLAVVFIIILFRPIFVTTTSSIINIDCSVFFFFRIN